ncbi:MAG TPA: hypothetical protein VE007_06560 [Thermoanaerobaculia bacterium]|nr:hypothetical protein [Thermoanaerobaculia bacterium]
MKRPWRLRAAALAGAGISLLSALAAGAGPGATASALLPARVEEVARAVERVRGRKFEKAVPASEIDGVELRRVLKAKVFEGFPASPENTMATLVALGFFDETPNLIDKLIDFYASQVIAFYDPEPRRFFLVRGAAEHLPDAGAAGELGGPMAEKMIFAHELTHALQDESLRLDRRIKALKENGDRALALESLLEGEATLVMVRVTLAELPGGESEEVEESLAPLLSAGALEKANLPKDLPDYFAEQLFFPYVEGTAYVRRLVKAGGWPAVDRLWKSPPASSSAILHDKATFEPAEHLLSDAEEKSGPEGARRLYSDTVGEWGVRFLLRKAIPKPDADAVAAGWRGDRIAFFGSPRAISYRWRIRFESGPAAERFETAWRTGRKRNERVARTGSDVTILSAVSARAS